ncbi:MAG: hypothetical protein IPN87_19310 [Saprospiraceae bacterium]|nr:hypothetical protein [Candidatus Brachybacter algidus]
MENTRNHESKHPILEEFLNLPAEEVAKAVRAKRPKSIVFLSMARAAGSCLSTGAVTTKTPAQAYVDITAQAYIATYKLVFDYGLDTIIAPFLAERYSTAAKNTCARSAQA